MPGSRGIRQAREFQRVFPPPDNQPGKQHTGKTRGGYKVTILESIKQRFLPRKGDMQAKASKNNNPFAAGKPLHSRTVRPAPVRVVISQQQFYQNATQQIMARGYSAEVAAGFLQGFIAIAGNNNQALTELINNMSPYNSHQQQWADWSVHELQRKDYSLVHASDVTSRGLNWAGRDMSKFKKYILNAPPPGQAAARQQQQDFDWAMQNFMLKGYSQQAAGQSIRNALKVFSGKRQVFIEWVKNAPAASQAQRRKSPNDAQYITKTLLPVMISELQKKGYSSRETEGIAHRLVQDNGGVERCNVQAVWQAALKMPTASDRENLPRQNAATLSKSEALKTLGLEAGATEQEIKKAHRKLALQYHGDHPGEENNTEDRENQFRKVQMAYERLTKFN